MIYSAAPPSGVFSAAAPFGVLPEVSVSSDFASVTAGASGLLSTASISATAEALSSAFVSEEISCWGVVFGNVGGALRAADVRISGATVGRENMSDNDRFTGVGLGLMQFQPPFSSTSTHSKANCVSAVMMCDTARLLLVLSLVMCGDA